MRGIHLQTLLPQGLKDTGQAQGPPGLALVDLAILDSPQVDRYLCPHLQMGTRGSERGKPCPKLT